MDVSFSISKSQPLMKLMYGRLARKAMQPSPSHDANQIIMGRVTSVGVHVKFLVIWYVIHSLMTPRHDT
jgi:hypothetical protein